MAKKRDARGADFHPSVKFHNVQIVHMCVTVSSMLSGLETRSHGLNTLAQRSLQPCHSLFKSVLNPPLSRFHQC